MTTDDTRTDRASEAGSGSSGTATLADVDHTHPHRDTTFGSVFGRGPTVAADGGEPGTSATAADDGASAADGSDAAPRTTMGELRHEAPTTAETNGAFERGGSGAGATAGVDATDTAASGSDTGEVRDR